MLYTQHCEHHLQTVAITKGVMGRLQR